MKIALIGSSPIANEKSGIRSAFGLRTLQFISAIHDSGDEICVITIDESANATESKKEIFGHDHFVFPKSKPRISKIADIVNEYNPDVIVAVNSPIAYLASVVIDKLKKKVPFWADLNGWMMAEAASQSYRMGSDAYMPKYWQMQKTILETADRFSAVSQNQKWANIGELSTLGRINSKTESYNFVDVIENANEQTIAYDDDGDRMIRGRHASDDDIVVAWIGGYNTWVDEDMLFQALESAMSKNEKIRFVSTGGVIKNLDNKSLNNFQKLISESKYKDRFVFLGWVDSQDMHKIYAESDIGICIDRDCIETQTGARNRLNEMIQFGLPIVASAGSEIANELRANNLARIIDSGDAKKLDESILDLAENPNMRNELAERAKKYANENWNYEKTMTPLINWLGNIQLAPDHGYKIDINKVSLFALGWKYFRKNGIKESIMQVKKVILK